MFTTDFKKHDASPVIRNLAPRLIEGIRNNYPLHHFYKSSFHFIQKNFDKGLT